MEHGIHADICKGTKKNQEGCIDCSIRDSVSRSKRRCPKTHYLFLAECDNCGYITLFTIPKGTFVRDYLRKLECNYCACPYYHSYSSVYGENDED